MLTICKAIDVGILSRCLMEHRTTITVLRTGTAGLIFKFIFTGPIDHLQIV